MGVSSCICFRTDFTTLKQIASSTSGTLHDLHAATGCGSRCGLCIPYIRLMLLSGWTDLPPLTPEDFKELGIRCSTLERLVSRLIERGEPITRDPEGARAVRAALERASQLQSQDAQSPSAR